MFYDIVFRDVFTNYGRYFAELYSNHDIWYSNF
jgi:hypothetical protein